MRAYILYCRVSTKSQGDAGHSLDVQEAALRRRAEYERWPPDAIELIHEVASAEAIDARPRMQDVLRRI